MTLTINVPDEIAAQVQALPEIERYYIDQAAAAVSAALLNRSAIVSGTGNTEAGYAPGIATRRRSLMDFSGIGKGQPGAIGEDVQGYINAMRDEWEEREREIDRHRDAATPA